MSSYKRIVVGTDGSDTSMHAVDRAAQLARDASAELTLVTAYRPESRTVIKQADDALGEDAFLVVGSAPAESMLRNAADRARSRGAGAVHTLAVQGNPVEVLEDAVTEIDADLLVVGNVGLNTLSGRILGSVPQSAARKSDVDVLIVHTS